MAKRWLIESRGKITGSPYSWEEEFAETIGDAIAQFTARYPMRYVVAATEVTKERRQESNP